VLLHCHRRNSCCANLALLRDKLRDELGFRGYVVSDCGAIENLYQTHHVASSYEEAVGLALHDGVVLDCRDTVQSHGMRSISDGYLLLNDVERALRNLFGVLHALGYFDESTEGLPVVNETQT
jgi:beta-glucosidase